jgi:hypothetical protein
MLLQLYVSLVLCLFQHIIPPTFSKAHALMCDFQLERNTLRNSNISGAAVIALPWLLQILYMITNKALQRSKTEKKYI